MLVEGHLENAAAEMLVHPSTLPPPPSCIPSGATLFAGLSEDDREALLICGRVHDYRPRRAMAIHGARPGRCWLLLEGHAKEHVVLDDGSTVITDVRGPGDLVGEAALVAGVPMAVDVSTVAEVRVIEFYGTLLLRLLESRPAIAGAMRRALADRAIAGQHVLVRNARCDTTERVVLALLRLQQRFGVDVPSGRWIGVPLSQRELASWTAMSRESMAKALRRLRRAGLVITSRRDVVLPDVDALASLV